MAAAFKIFIRRQGEVEGAEVEVTPDTTIRTIKEEQQLKGHQLYFKKPWKDANRVSELGIKAADTITATKTCQTPVRQAELRRQDGRTKTSHQYRHLMRNLILDEAAAGMGTTVNQGVLTRETVTQESEAIRQKIDDSEDKVVSKVGK